MSEYPPEDFEVDEFDLIYSFKDTSPFPQKRLEQLLQTELEYEHEEGGSIRFDESGVPEIQDAYTKDDVSISYVPNPGMLAMRFPMAQLDIRSRIKNIDRGMRDKLSVADEDIESYRFSFKGRIWDGEDTVKYFENIYNMDLSNCGLVGDSPKPFAIRTISGLDSDESPYHNIRIEPYIQNTDYFFVDLDVMDNQKEDILDFADDLVDELNQIIKEVKENVDG
jgi:hypothetical protein